LTSTATSSYRPEVVALILALAREAKDSFEIAKFAGPGAPIVGVVAAVGGVYGYNSTKEDRGEALGWGLFWGAVVGLVLYTGGYFAVIQ
jgi:hypothetical protein